MGKIAFLFPGQGSQKAGMGKDALETAPELYDRYLTAADEASGLEIRRLSLEGPQEALTETNVAQPALFALSLALTEAASDTGLRPDFVAGHSLGEYTAAVAAGALSFEDGIRLVSLRGRLMAEAQSVRPGTMAAVIGLDAERLEELCRGLQGRGGNRPALCRQPRKRSARRTEHQRHAAEPAGRRRVVPGRCRTRQDQRGLALTRARSSSHSAAASMAMNSAKPQNS